MELFQSFIEGPVFPVAKLSAECFKERKAGSGQTLTGLGKWWGRKPLILIRAILLGHLMPCSGNPEKDLDTFLRVLTMDEDGLKQRQKKKVDWRTMQGKSYAEKIKNAYRPEEIAGPSDDAWAVINARLDTKAATLVELFQQLSIKRFGQVCTVGDCFCGGGSTPFESARVGLNAYASDLNPIACLLTWGALNIIGGGPERVEEVKREQERVYGEVEAQVAKWGIEKSKEGWQAEYYLYCVEVKFPDGWMVPLAPSWVIGKKTNTIAKLVPNQRQKRFDFEIISDATDAEMAAAEIGTVGKGGSLTNPYNGKTVKLGTLRGDHDVVVGHDENGKEIKESRNKLRLWGKEDVVPRPEDLFQERLYCIRWRKQDGKQEYRAPDKHDMAVEARVLQLLKERLSDWQEAGHIPSSKIEPGVETTRLYRERGWTHWHHLFNPRQLLVGGIVQERTDILTGLHFLKTLDFQTKACQWTGSSGYEKSAHYFCNQAFNTLFNWATRSSKTQLAENEISGSIIHGEYNIQTADGKTVQMPSGLWLTDPPYADAINYDELSEFFLAWVAKKLQEHFSDLCVDSKRALAVRGDGVPFVDAMVKVYDNLRRHTTAGGAQTVMFTHSSNDVWIQLSQIIWKSGLHASSLWAIRTETENAAKGNGNYVQATYLITLRERSGSKMGSKMRVRDEVLSEVERLYKSMTSFEKSESAEFSELDFGLIPATAVLKVLTAYGEDCIIGLPEQERDKFQRNLLDEASRVIADKRRPDLIECEVWGKLGNAEKFYLMGLEQERRGNNSVQYYMNASRSCGIADYRELLGEVVANQARLQHPGEVRGRDRIARVLGTGPLFAMLTALNTAVEEEDEDAGHQRIKELVNTGDAEQVKALKQISHFLASLACLQHWERYAKLAESMAPGIGRV